MHRWLARIAALVVLALVGALVPAVGAGAAAPVELTYACALKSNGLMRAVSSPLLCTKQERVVWIKPGPHVVCVQPGGSTRLARSAADCRRPARAVVLPPTSGVVHFCAKPFHWPFRAGGLRYVTGPGQCRSGERAYQVTPADAPPRVVSTTPASGAANVGTTGPFSATFSEPVTATSGALTLTCRGTSRAGTVGGSPGTTITFTPAAALPEAAACTLRVLASGIRDVDTLDPPDRPTGDTTVTFTTDTAPTVVRTNPADGATGVATTTAPSVSFSEPVSAPASAFTLTCGGSARPFTLSGSGGTTGVLALTPTGGLPGASTCTVTLDPTGVNDVDGGDPPDALASGVSFSFTTADTAPTVVGTSPAHGASGFGTQADLTVTFSEPVTAEPGAFTLACPTGTDVPLTATVSGSTATLDPAASLPEGVTCTLTVEAGLVRDVDGVDPPDALASDVTVTFTTDTAPSLTQSSPADGAVDVPASADVTLTFSEPVRAGTGALTLTCGGTPRPATLSGDGTATLVLDPDDDLPGAASCTVSVDGSAVTDADGGDPPDRLTGDPTISFTTTDVAPTVLRTSPTNTATQVATTGDITITFSEPVTVGAAAFTLQCPDGTDLPFAATVSADGTVVTLDPAAALPVGTACTVRVDGSQVRDVDPVDPPDTMAADHTFGFTTDAPPRVTDTTPADGARDVAVDAALGVTFSEPVDVTTAAVTLHCEGAAVPVSTTGSGTTTLTVTPAAALPATASCTLAVVAAEVSDVDAGDPPDSPTADTTVTFTTVDTAPTVLATDPAGGATDVAPGTDVTVTFSEPVATSAAAFTLACPTGTDLPFAFATSGGGTVVVLDPTASLPRGQTCTLTVAGAGVTDLDTVDPPDRMAADVTVSFTVAPNAAPTDLTLAPTSVPENRPTGTTVGTLTTTDPDAGDTFTYSLAAGAGDTDNASFAVTGDRLVTAAVFDHESKAAYSVRLRTTDAAGAPFEKAVTVTVTDVNEAPTDITLSSASVDENSAAGTTVGTLSAADPDTGQTATFTLVAGCGGAPSDNASFTISGTVLRTAAPLDHETRASYAVCVRATDDGTPPLSLDKVLTVTVNDVNDPPVAVPDAYSGVVGNTLALVGGGTAPAPNVALTGAVPIANDTDQDTGAFAATLTAVPGTIATTGGGTVTLAADGRFSYLPGPGDKSQSDTFGYGVTDGRATTTGTVTMTIGADLVWYVDASASPTGADGRSTSPYPGLGPLNGAGGTGDVDGPGDVVFLYTATSGTTPYAGGLPLEANQRLRGQRAGLTLGGTTLVPAGPASAVVTNAAGDGLALASGVDVQGVDVRGASRHGIAATNVTTATVGSAALPVSVTGSGSDGVHVEGGSGALDLATAVSGSGASVASARSVFVSGRTGGTSSFTQAITGKGVVLTSNTGATVAFTGALTLTASTGPAFSATGGGTVTSTVATSTVTASAGTGLEVSGTTIGAAGLTFRSVSASGGANGIALSNTGASGGLTVTGNGTATVGGDASGGTISGTTAVGVQLTNTRDVSLRNVTVSNTPNAAGVRGTGVTNFTFRNGTVTGSGGTSRNSNTDSNLDFSGGGAGTNVTGTFDVRDTVLTNAWKNAVDLLNYGGTLSVTITGNTMTAPTTTANASPNSSAVQVQALGSTTAAATVSGGSIAGNTIRNFQNLGIGLYGGNVSAVGAPGATVGTAGSRFAISGNTVRGQSAAARMATNCILVAMRTYGTGAVDVVNNGTGAAPLGLNQGNCVSVNAIGAFTLSSRVTGNVVDGTSQNSGAFGISGGADRDTAPAADTARLDLVATGNTVRNTPNSGIFFLANGTGTLNARIEDNTVGAPTDATPAYGIRVASGTSSGTAVDSTVCVSLARNTTAGGTDGTLTAPGIGLRKQGTVAATNDFGIVALSPSPATATQTEAFVSAANPASTAGTFGTGGAAVISGSSFSACSLPGGL